MHRWMRWWAFLARACVRHNAADRSPKFAALSRVQPRSVLFVRTVKILAGWQVAKLLEMLRPQRLGDGVLATKPFAQIDQTATLGTERTIFRGEPITALAAGGADDFRIGHNELSHAGPVISTRKRN